MRRKSFPSKIGKKISGKLPKLNKGRGIDLAAEKYLSPYYSHGRFLNYEEDDKTLAMRSFQKFIKWKWFTPLEKPDIPATDWLKIEEPPMVYRTSPLELEPSATDSTDSTDSTDRADNIRAVWFGHSSLWFCFSWYKTATSASASATTASASATRKLKTVNVLVDPVLGDISYLLKRMTPLPIRKSKLPNVDAILISHAHRDHLDLKSLRFLMERNPKLKLYAPEGSELFFRKDFFLSRLQILRWYEVIDLQGIRIQFLPAQHWSQMRLNDYLQIHWGSYAFTIGNQSLYFAGDTAYAGHFKHIADLYPQGFAAAFIPIGSFKPRSFMRTSHIAPEEALQASLDLGARVLFPIHWGTFHLGDDLPQEAIYHLRHYAKRLFGNTMQKKISFWHPGQYVDFPFKQQ